jgi:two-component system sensor histidine kinase SenX3
MNTAAVVAVAVAAGLLGWLAAVLVLRRHQDEQLERQGDGDPLARAILAETRTGYAILDEQQHVLLANARAVELGVIRAGFADARIVEAAERALISGEPVDVDLTEKAGRGVPRQVHAEVRQIDEGTVLVIGADESAAVRTEAVRRDFVANISHELKTPIGAISLLAEAVLDGADDPDTVRHFTSKIAKESTRLGTLVSELISLSKLQGGGDASLEQTLVGLDGVIEEVISRTVTIADAAGITVGVGGTPGIFVRGDRTLLITALTNLVDNAVHYSPAGTPVTINRVVRDDTVEIAVTDRGSGIPVAQQERVFERFFRADPARSRQTGGTGLGLAIVKHVAANHGGEVTLWSRVGTGSTFTIRLPATHRSPMVGHPLPGLDRVGGTPVRPSSTSGSPSAVIPGGVDPLSGSTPVTRS